MFWMYLNQKRFLNYMYLKLNNNNFTLSNQFDCSYTCLVFVPEKTKWRNIRKNHKRTSGMEHILKYINIVTASCDIHIEIDLRTNIIFCNMQFMYLVKYTR